MPKKIGYEVSSGNVFHDIGFSDAEAAEAIAKSELILAMARTIKRRRLTQSQAARICRTDQPALSRVLRGRMSSLSIDRLTTWLVALGHDVQITVNLPRRSRPGRFLVKAA
ncbi:MAG: XRE family transcriptional regulator [Alphaproteobacteria bacterium]|nr:XRE family transcriptional regulator [Alphaproteobacteria bacterium]